MAKVLIIEDQAVLCRLYETVLRRFEHDVTTVHSGEAGVAAALRLSPDLVVMDMVLPGISGAEVAEKLREAGILPSTPLILTTALGDDAAQFAARSIGATDLLLKPFEIGMMLASVHAALSPSANTPPSQQVASGA